MSKYKYLIRIDKIVIILIAIEITIITLIKCVIKQY